MTDSHLDAAGANGGTQRRWVPAMDLVETEDHFILRADLPGMTEDDIAIELEVNVLTVSGERKPRRVSIGVGGGQGAIEGSESQQS